MRTLPRLTFFLFAFLGFLGSGTARAEVDKPTELARSHMRAGAAYYGDAKYEDAAREMQEAYRNKPLAELQYNLAQCFERLGRARDAASAYRAYLTGKPAAEDAGEVAVRIKNLDERAAREAQGAPPPPPQIIEKEKVVLKEVVVYREAPPRPGRAARFVAYGLGAVALAAAASGITFAVLAKRDADQVAAGGDPAAPVFFDSTAGATQAAGRQDQVLSYASFGLAAIAAGTAVGMYALGNHVDREAAAARVTLSPSIFPGGGGLAVGGSF